MEGCCVAAPAYDVELDSITSSLDTGDKAYFDSRKANIVFRGKVLGCNPSRRLARSAQKDLFLYFKADPVWGEVYRRFDFTLVLYYACKSGSKEITRAAVDQLKFDRVNFSQLIVTKKGEFIHSTRHVLHVIAQYRTDDSDYFLNLLREVAGPDDRNLWLTKTQSKYPLRTFIAAPEPNPLQRAIQYANLKFIQFYAETLGIIPTPEMLKLAQELSASAGKANKARYDAVVSYLTSRRSTASPSARAVAGAAGGAGAAADTGGVVVEWDAAGGAAAAAEKTVLINPLNALRRGH